MDDRVGVLERVSVGFWVEDVGAFPVDVFRPGGRGGFGGYRGPVGFAGAAG